MKAQLVQGQLFTTQGGTPGAQPECLRAYEAARRQVSRHIAAMRAVFKVYLGLRTWQERERGEGRLDRGSRQLFVDLEHLQRMCGATLFH